MRRCLVPVASIALLVTSVVLGPCSAAELPIRPWSRSTTSDEQSFFAPVDPDARIYVNAPLDADGKPARGTQVIVFALPNGNSLEWTLGAKMSEGMDWHYDIQHVLAQVRAYRELVPDEKVVLICAEAKGRSWPTWRKNHEDANAKIAAMVDAWRNEFGAPDAKVILTGHSGGGGFKYGVIDGQENIPAYIDRIAFLDSDYTFEPQVHADKYWRWLESDPSHHLVVICYDDRNIMLNGKKVITTDTGGTFRHAARMREALGEHFEITETEKPPFQEYTGLDKRFHNFVHPNPENKILHTVLVGEMNGLLEALTVDTPNEEKWGTFGGPRAYTKWVPQEPIVDPNAPPPTKKPEKPDDKASAATTPTPLPQLPPRPADAMGGRAFVESIADLDRDAREAAILREITSGNFPQFLRNFKKVPIHGTADTGEIATTLVVMPDYLAVGSDDDFVRMPMNPQTAQQIADKFGCTLPTRKMVDAIDAQAELHLEPKPLTEAREAVKTFEQHHDIIEGQRDGKPLGQLVIGIKKDIVLTPRIFEKPNRLAIYGWRKLDGTPIQPLTIVHVNWYVDYSHGVRLVGNKVIVDGEEVAISDLLTDPKRAALVSDEGTMTPPRYPL